MGKEIERKFLLKNDSWKSEVLSSTTIRQGYLSTDIERNVRIRLKEDAGIITIKGKTENVSRTEFEYYIPKDDAIQLLKMCHYPLVEKTRHEVIYKGKVWEIDEFFGDNEGLIVAEIELESEEQTFELPDWLGIEVSHDVRYYNVNLLEHPFKNW